jgi:hypothetical protein
MGWFKQRAIEIQEAKLNNIVRAPDRELLDESEREAKRCDLCGLWTVEEKRLYGYDLISEYTFSVCVPCLAPRPSLREAQAEYFGPDSKED